MRYQNKEPLYSKKQSRAITFGYLWRWGSILINILVPAIVFGICELLHLSLEVKGLATFLSFGITMLCVGTYDIIGAGFEFKHIIVSLQLATHIPFRNIDPRRSWTKSEKKESIGLGVVLIVVGLMITAITICVYKYY